MALIAIVGAHPLHRAAAQGGLGLARHDPRASRHGAPRMPQPVLGDIALFVALALAVFAVLFGTRHIDATEHQDGLMLAIATESLVKLVAFLAVGVFVTFWHVRRAGRRCSPRRWSRRDTAADARRARRCWSTLAGDDAAVVRRHPAAAAAVPRHRRREPQRSRDPPRRLAVSALSRADQPVRAADRGRRPAHVPARRASTATCSCWRCRCARLRAARARRLRRRALGGDRDGDRRTRRARHHDLERSRRAAGPAAPRSDPVEPRRTSARCCSTVRRVAIFVILLLAYLYYRFGRRGAARLDRPAVVRGHRAARAGLLRRPVLAARHRARRARRHDGRHSGLGLYAAAAELRGRRPGRQGDPRRAARSASRC